jgi:LmbE family N-acetylglucosaminyl deacetylase
MMAAREMLAAMRRLPFADVRDILGGARALILAPHPDDESLGCGGLIAAACAAGMPPVIVFLTDGAASHPGSRTHPPARLSALREAEARRALALLGLPREEPVYTLRFPDTQLPSGGAGFFQAVETLHGIALAEGCGIILGPWTHDPHCDHEAGARMAAALAQMLGLSLLSYPVWGWLRDGLDELPGDVHGYRLEISRFLAAKQSAIAAHASQYSGLITDSPAGFRLPADLLAVAARPFEVFLSA